MVLVVLHYLVAKPVQCYLSNNHYHFQKVCYPEEQVWWIYLDVQRTCHLWSPTSEQNTAEATHVSPSWRGCPVDHLGFILSRRRSTTKIPSYRYRFAGLLGWSKMAFSLIRLKLTPAGQGSSKYLRIQCPGAEPFSMDQILLNLTDHTDSLLRGGGIIFVRLLLF